MTLGQNEVRETQESTSYGTLSSSKTFFPWRSTLGDILNIWPTAEDITQSGTPGGKRF